MDSYTSGRTSQSKLSLSHRLLLGMVFYHSDRKVTDTLTQDMIFLLCARAAEDPVWGEGPLCFYPEDSTLPLSFPAISFISCGFLSAPLPPKSSTTDNGFDHDNPFASFFQRRETLCLLALCRSTMQFTRRTSSAQVTWPISSL